MSEAKRKSDGRDKARRRFRTDGTPIWGQRNIDGPGVWVTCVKGKEKQTVGELYDVFEALANQLWPMESVTACDAPQGSDGDDDEGADDIEKQIAKEVASMKRPRKETRFANCQTNTPCVVFISCKPPIDPVKLVVTHVQNIADTGVTHTRFSQRLTPVAGSCVANIPEIQSMCTRIVRTAFSEQPEKKFKYKIELRMRNHNTLTRDKLIPELAKCVPEGHIVSLNDPELFILVEIFKSVCGISVVKDYYNLQKFNVVEIANAKNLKDGNAAGRISGKEKGDAGPSIVPTSTETEADV
ncbi:hypothetical protein LXA43DRAFT_1138693 [Ganoderma leucocontextum]|nr:hypothetical protein LXA43DRAFT_1138693 [Ganoderma leucocontextum]